MPYHYTKQVWNPNGSPPMGLEAGSIECRLYIVSPGADFVSLFTFSGL